MPYVVRLEPHRRHARRGSAPAHLLKMNELYGTPACPFTAELREDLEWRGVAFTEYDVESDRAALARASADERRTHGAGVRGRRPGEARRVRRPRLHRRRFVGRFLDAERRAFLSWQSSATAFAGHDRDHGTRRAMAERFVEIGTNVS